MKKLYFLVLIMFVLCSFIVTNIAQTSSRKKKGTKTKSVKSLENSPSAIVKEATPPKKNERPTDSPDSGQTETKANRRNGDTATARVTNTEQESARSYSYQFTQPNFLITKIIITHDEKGKGTIAFQQRDSDEKITDPLQVSPAALEKIQKLWAELNFLDSTENYQAEKQFPHLGTMSLTLKNGAKNRTTEFNWTNNKTAESLVNEYKKLSYQFIWIFDINVARENQPLETPSLIDQLENMIQRDNVSDAIQLMPFLQELRDDERLPLIARNGLVRIIQKIEKSKDKK